MKVRVTKTPRGKKADIYYGGELDPVTVSAFKVPPLLGEDEEQAFPTYPVEPSLSDADIRKLQKALEKKETPAEKKQRRAMQDAALTGMYMGTPVDMNMSFMPQYAFGGIAEEEDSTYMGQTTRKDVSKGKMKASFEVPVNLGYGVTPTPAPVATPLPKKVKYETLNLSNGRQVYSPVFQGSWTDAEISDYWKNIPESASNGREILRGQAWQDVQGNKMAKATMPKASDTVRPVFTGTSPYGGSYTDIFRNSAARGATMAYGGRLRYPGGGMTPDMVPIEAEGGEMIQTPNGELSEITGPNHESGGEDMVVPEGSKIYSKRIKIDGKSMAQRKEARDRKMNRLAKVLETDITNQLYRNTAKRTALGIAKQEAMDMQIMEVANPIMQAEMEAKEQKKKGYGGYISKGMKGMEDDVYGGGLGDGTSIMKQGMISNLGSAATGIATLIAQAAKGKPDEVRNPLFAETAHLRPYMAGGGKAHWIQGAVNPAHKGYCTPMTKATCTPRRKAFAMTMKKHHGFHAGGGGVYPDPYTYYNLPQPDGFGGYRIKAADEMLGPYSPNWLNNQNKMGTGFETWPGGPSMDQLTYDVNNPNGRFPVAQDNLNEFTARTANQAGNIYGNTYGNLPADYKEGTPNFGTAPGKGLEMNTFTFSAPKVNRTGSIVDDFGYPSVGYMGSYNPDREPAAPYGDLNTGNFWQGFDRSRYEPQIRKPRNFIYQDTPSAYEQEYEVNSQYHPNYSRLLMTGQGDETYYYPWAGTGKLKGSLPAPQGRDANLYGTTIGNIVGGIGTGVGTLGPLMATIKNRRGDKPNINAFRDFGRKALDANTLAQDLVAKAGAAAQINARISNNTAKARNRNSAQSINTLRGLDAVTDLQTDQVNAGITSNEAQQMINLLSARTGLLNQRDQAVMQGEQTRDLADRRDRDAYFNNLSRNLSDMGTGLQTFGKNINQDQYNRESLGLMNELSKYGLGYKKVGGQYQLVKIGPAQKGYEPVNTSGTTTTE